MTTSGVGGPGRARVETDEVPPAGAPAADATTTGGAGASSATSSGLAAKGLSGKMGGAALEAQLADKIAALEAKGKGKPSAAAAGAPADVSPTGAKYLEKSKITKEQEQAKVFGKDGKVNGAVMLEHLTQVDTSDATIDDENRCGAQTAVAAALMSKDPKKALGKLADAVAATPNGSAFKDEIMEVKKKVEDGTATLEDMNRLADLAYMSYSFDTTQGMTNDDVARLYKDAGLADGNARPVLIDTNKDGVGNHWVLKGMDPKGKPYYYDPWPKSGDQIVHQGSPAYKKYDAAAPESVRDGADTAMTTKKK